MHSPQEEINPTQLDRLNYFNYFTEVEEEFVRRRGSHMLISSLDWALVESWKHAGLPLHIVLRGINQAFDAYDARPHKNRKVNSVLYCQQSVEEAFAEYRLSQVGSSPSVSAQAGNDKAGPTFSKETLLEFIDRCLEDLELLVRKYQGPDVGDMSSGALKSKSDSSPALPDGRATDTGRSGALKSNSDSSPEDDSYIIAPSSRGSLFIDGVARACERLSEIRKEIESAVQVDAEELERDLDSLDRMLLESIKNACSEGEIDAIRKEAKSQLRGYKRKMEKSIYDQTVENFIARRLREVNQLPRLSLFYC